MRSTAPSKKDKPTQQASVEWIGIQSYNVPYLLFYYLYNPRAGFPLIQVPLLGHLLTLISIALISKRLQCRLPPPQCGYRRYD